MILIPGSENNNDNQTDIRNESTTNHELVSASAPVINNYERDRNVIKTG